MSKKSIVKVISLVLSVLILLTVLPVGVFAAETDAVATESVTHVETNQDDAVVSDGNTDSTEIWSPSESSLSSNIELDSESDPEPLSQAELTTIIQNGKMERISADNVPDVVGFETAKSRNHVARAYEKEKDDLNSLIFLNEDGTYTKYIYDYPVKFKDENGKIKDTSLQVISDSKGGYKRKQGDSTAHFSEKMSDGIGLSSDELSVLLIPKPSTFVKPKPNLSQVASKKLSGLLQSTDKVNSLDNKTVSYYYNDSTTLEYSLTYLGFKEDIVVSEYTGQTEYVFTLKTNGLALTETDGNFYLTDDQGNIKVSLGQVIIFTADERNNTFGSMTAETVTENQEYTITLHVDADWLKDEKTAYPIRIDPTLELVNREDSLVEDVVINSDNTISNRYTQALKVGKNEDGTYSRILIKFNYDFGSFANGPLKIHRAYVEMRDLMCQTESMTVMSEMYVGTNWSEDADWSMIARGVHTHYMASMPIYYDKGNGYTEKHRYSISILDAMKYWVAEANNTPDYYQASPQGGIMIKAYDEVEQGNTAITKSFGSSNHPTSAYRPSLSVTYYDQHTQYSDPFGHLDAVTSDSIRGWVWCVDLPEQSVPVSIYLENETTGEAWPGIYLSGEATSLHRPDVESAGYGTGCYGFNYPIDWSKYSSGRYKVRAKWHSMNGTGLQSDLFNGPIYYQNYPYENGEYYINNKEHGRYLKNTDNSTDVKSGQLAHLGDGIKWNLTQYREGYVIQNDQSKYLAIISGNLTFRPSTSELTNEYIWDLIYDGGYCLRNRHSKQYVYTNGTNLLIDTSSGQSGTVSNREHIWRIVSTSEYGDGEGYKYKEHFLIDIESPIILKVGQSQDLSNINNKPNYLWCDDEDYVIQTSSNHVTLNNSSRTIVGVASGESELIVTHKVSGRRHQIKMFVCDYELFVNNYYDHSYHVFYNITEEQAIDEINNYIDNIKKDFAEKFSVKITRNNATYFQTHLDYCKGTVTTANLDVMCEHICYGPDDSINDDDFKYSSGTGLLKEFNKQHCGSGNTVDILWSCHRIAPSNEFVEDVANYNRSFSFTLSDENQVIKQRNIVLINRYLPNDNNDINSNYVTKRKKVIGGAIRHELAHVVGAEDHYHEQLREEYIGCGNPECCEPEILPCLTKNCCGQTECCKLPTICCGNPGCIECHEWKDILYSEVCCMLESDRYNDSHCDGCIAFVKEYLSSSDYFD